MERSRVACIIPAYNEEASIKQVVASVSSVCIPIVVDDGSIDSTYDISVASEAIVVRHKRNKGYEQALESGFQEALNKKFDYVVTIDGDGQHDTSVISRFIDALDDGADVVIGIRDKKQRIAEHIFALLSSLRWGIKDPLCGMKAYKIHVYKELGYFDSFSSVGTELAFFAAKKEKKITQFNLKTYDREGRSRFGSVISANYKIMRIIIKSLA